MKTIYVENTILTKDKKFSYLSTACTSAQSSLVVQSIVGFTVNQLVCVGKIGGEKTELVKTGTPVSNYIPLQTAVSFDHPVDTPVTVVDWDYISFYNAATIAGVKTLLGTASIQVDLPETIYNDSTVTSGYFFTRFRESISSGSSEFSDGVPFAGYGDNTVFMIKKRALDSLNEKIDTDIVTHEFLNESLWQARREYHNSPGKRPFRRKYNVDLGNVSTGMYRVNLPSDIESPHSAENLYGVRIGTSGNLEYYDKKDWDSDYQDVGHTILDVAYTIGDQDLWCSDVRDFDDSGSVVVENDTIEYSAKGVTGGTLRISTDGSYNHVIASDVWQNASFGLPSRFAVFVDSAGSASIFFNRPFETAYVNQNIWGDYYRTVVAYDSDADELDEPNYDMFVPYLAFRIKQKKNQGLQALKDPDYTQWQLLKQNALNTEYLGAEVRITPDIPDLPIND